MIELLNRRTADSKHFWLGGNKYRAVIQRGQHIQRYGVWWTVAELRRELIRRGVYLAVASELAALQFVSAQDTTACDDSRISVLAPTTNYAAIAEYYVGDGSSGASDNSRFFLKFDLSSIPSTSTITGVTIRLWESDAARSAAQTADNVNFYRVLRNWTETGVTWNKYDGTNDWATAGATNATDVDADVSCALAMDHVAALAMVSFVNDGADPSLKNDVQNFVNGTWANYGWLLRKPTWEALGGAPYAYNQFDASDHATASHRPQIVVDYTAAGGASGFMTLNKWWG